MAAPSIPNLNTLRGRGGLRSRGRGRGAGPDEDKELARDKIIQQTDGDATSSRMSAVALSYLDDPFAQAFLQGQQIARRYPIINRGTYVRTTAIDRLVTRFLNVDPSQKKQIVSLGAGSDTRFFRLKRDYSGRELRLVYHEIDFPANTSQKISVVTQSEALRSYIEPQENGALNLNEDRTALLSSTYNIQPLDLRSITPAHPPVLPNLDPDLPTLLLSECCLCYLAPDSTNTILEGLTSLLNKTASVAVVLYEPIRPFDAFGRTMISNLGSRGIELQTVKRFCSLRAQRMRLERAGFGGGQGARDVEQIYYGRRKANEDSDVRLQKDGEPDEGGEQWITEQERERIEGLEWLDEVEEWKLLAAHYCVAWGWRGGVDGRDVFREAWRDIAGGWTSKEKGDDELG